MLDINLIRKNPELVKTKIKQKGVSPEIVDEFLAVDSAWREQTEARDTKKAAQKDASSAQDFDRAKALKSEIQSLDDSLRDLTESRDSLLLSIPNLPSNETPIGRDESENVVLKEVGQKPEFSFTPKSHLELGLGLGLLDTERAARVSGARFNYLLNELALMAMGLVQLAWQEGVKENFTPMIPPVLAKSEIMKAMGKAKFLEEKDAFYLPEDDLYLIGSAEHTIGPFHLGETLSLAELPKRYMAFSTAFRREAGSYGKDTQGMLRLHQFNKVEMFSFAHPDHSAQEHAFLLSLQERLLQKLELPYRVVDVCTGDMTWGDTRQFDIETWLPSQNTYRETNSCSNTGDYQARGLNTRFRDSDGELKFVHTLNATAFSERPLIAILENYQTEDGKVRVPTALQSFVGKDIIG